ncbi:hypothetical protein L6164_027679 [Bauhinia variegata]|uniref:Uncharacterized protein n=1 Tax=Bauhinia variegata TaxID=167791 RepID=A0ACB9LUN5_BAUVA|nr:hypothetical protein L6164_027679 [Bauhinia variegata]
MAEVAVSIVVEKLTELLLEEAASLHRVLDGLSEKVDQLKDQLKWMQCFLRDAEAKQEGNQLVRRWVSDIRDAAFEAEDLIETYAYEAACQNKWGRVFKLVHLYKVRRKIERLRKKIKGISAQREMYGLVRSNRDEGNGANSTNERLKLWRQPSPYSEGDYVIELKDDIELLLMQLLKLEPRRHVVSIVGMPGSGKTTVAKKLYNHGKIKEHFDFKAWVYVSKEYKRRDIVLGILREAKAFNMDAIERSQEEELTHLLHNYLDERRYVVVLDDIWGMEVCDGLESAFPRGKKGSKVILTTRNMEVALHADAGSNPHQLRKLTVDESLKLLGNKAFPDMDVIPPELENLSREVVDKCGGLPLAVVVVGGLLSRKRGSTKEWMQVLKNISWHLLEGEDNRIAEILTLSYNDLPPHLKSCFLYLGLFPQDMTIPTKKLVRLWVAEGFLPQEGEETAEGVALKCLNELIGRCMIQVEKASSLGRVKTIRIHDLLRDFSVSKGKEEYFLKICAGMEGLSASQLTKSRRHAIHSCYERYDFLKHNAHHSHSFLFFNREYNEEVVRRIRFHRSEKKLDFIYRKFKLLRVLDLDGVRVVCLPNTIGDLIQLRYLGLRKTNLEEELPDSIGNLQNLQTLDLRYCCFLKRIPNVIWKMVNLRHLLLYTPFDSPDSSHLRMDTLRNLQSLPYIEAGRWIDRDLAKMSNIRQLGIYELSRTMVNSVLSTAAQRLSHLHSLSLTLQSEREEFPILMQLSQCNHLIKLSLNGKINRLPEQHEFPPNLMKLTLHNSLLQMESIAKLERLPNLKMLVLGKGAHNCPELIFSAEGFPQLRILRFNLLNELEEWTVEERALPRLEQLVINRCEKLKKIPERLKDVTTLKKIKIVGMPVEFEHRLGTIDLADFQSTPSIESTTDILANERSGDVNRRHNVSG